MCSYALRRFYGRKEVQREIDDRPLLLLYDNPSENRVDTRLPRNFLNKSAFSSTHAFEMQRGTQRKTNKWGKLRIDFALIDVAANNIDPESK